jgi:dolichyl-phosphate beta-glucosyltransferase
VTPRLSVVIPAYNEERRLSKSLGRIRAFLEARAESFEILVADDGSRDATAAVAAAEGGPALRVLRSDRNRGKGHAVRRGMLAARGERRLMTDADLSTPLEELPSLEARLDAGFDVAIGSRAVRGARIEVHQSLFRETAGRAFNVLVRLLLLPGVRDTQCGFKLYTARAAQAAFERVRLDGFSFDVEALYVARRLGLRMTEVPVLWRNDAATRVGGLSGALAFLDLLRIRLNGMRGRYREAL